MHDCGVREALRQEVAGHGVLVFPLLGCCDFTICGLIRILGLGMCPCAGKVAPSLSDLHCIMEAHLEDGPVCTIGL